MGRNNSALVDGYEIDQRLNLQKIGKSKETLDSSKTTHLELVKGGVKDGVEEIVVTDIPSIYTKNRLTTDEEPTIKWIF